MKKLLPFLFTAIVIIIGCTSKTIDIKRPLKAPSGYMNETFIKISYFLGMIDLIEIKPEVPADIQVIKNVEYKNVDSISLQLDLYKLKTLKSPAPAMIFIHGGAWRSGERSDYLPYLIDYAKKGYVTITVSYRLVKTAIFPAAVQDVNCAVQWIQNHAAAYGIDPERLALIGGSAGGHLAMMAGYAGDEPMFNKDCQENSTRKVKAIINLYGPTDLTTPYSINTYQAKDFIGSTFEENPEYYKLASPKTFITSDDPPTLIFHGTIDSLVPISQSDSLAKWLSNAGVPSDYHRLKGWPHTMDISAKVNAYCQYYIDDFLKKYL